MDAREQLLSDIASGRMTVEQLVDRVVALETQLRDAHHRIAQLEAKLHPPPPLDYSMQAEEKRQSARGRKPKKTKTLTRRGRISTATKIAQAKQTIAVYPEGVDPKLCKLSHTRVLWQLDESRQAI